MEGLATLARAKVCIPRVLTSWESWRIRLKAITTVSREKIPTFAFEKKKKFHSYFSGRKKAFLEYLGNHGSREIKEYMAALNQQKK